MALAYRFWSDPLPLKEARRYMKAAERARNRSKRRKSVDRKRRIEIFVRDNGRCVYCGLQVSLATMTLDHVLPASRGGPGAKWNLVTSCQPCNQQKADKNLKDLAGFFRRREA